MKRMFCDICGRELITADPVIGKIKISSSQRNLEDVHRNKWKMVYCDEICECCTKEVAAIVLRYVHDKGGHCGYSV